MVRVRRREFLVCVAALGAARFACAQAQSPMQTKTLGILSRSSAQEAEKFAVRALREKLKSLGWIENQNLIIDGAYADGNVDRLPALAKELVQRKPDAIWVALNETAVAVAQATRTIPIVFFNVAFPVELGLIESFGRPGRNVTGVSFNIGIEETVKRLEFLKEIAPNAMRLSWIQDTSTLPKVDGGEFNPRIAIAAAATKLGYQIQFHPVRRKEDFENAFAEILAWRAQALSVGAGLTVGLEVERITEFCTRNRLPSAHQLSTMVDAGGLLSFNAVRDASGLTRSVEYVDRIFRGARPADLPVERPTKFELVINLKTAKSLGLTVPKSLLVRADRVIE
jgi:putative ABC transport system substrate-binding protein